MMNKSTLRYLLRILLSKVDLKLLQKLIWQKRTLLLKVQHFCTHGAILVNPVNLLNKGLLCGQVVHVSITYRNGRGEYKEKERLMVVNSYSSLGPYEFMIGDSDRFNIFGHDENVTLARLDSIQPYRSLPKYCRLLRTPDDVRLSPLKQPSVKLSESLGETLHDLLKIPRVVYKGDVLMVNLKHALVAEGTSRAVRVDYNGGSPCILNQSCTLYELANVSAPIPNGGLAIPKFSLPLSTQELLKRMRDVYFAYQSIHGYPLVYLLNGSSGCGKKLLCERLAIATHQNYLNASSYESWSEVSAQSEQKLKHLFDRAKSFQPCILYISCVDVLGFDPNSGEPDHRVLTALEHYLSEATNITVVLSCHSDKLAHISNTLKSLALYDFQITHLDKEARHYILSQFMDQEMSNYCARNTSGFSLAELFSLMEDIEYSCHEQTCKLEEIIEKAIDKRNAEFADSIGAPKIPTVSWNDVGGLEDTKQLVIESIEASLHGDDSLRRSGIIMFGPPGCGKTLIAKAVATEFKIAFLSVKGPELLNKYVGQSEENLRKVFERARQASPCVIFFDEIDSLAPNRGRNGDSGGVMDRIVSQLLAEMDDLLSDQQCKVFVMAATNRADLLDPALLTPGRFDKVVNVAPGTSVDTKVKILTAICRKIKLGCDVNLEEIASNCPSVMSGAELYSVVSTAAMAALREEVKLLETKNENQSEARVLVSRRHLLIALENIQTRTTITNIY